MHGGSAGFIFVGSSQTWQMLIAIAEVRDRRDSLLEMRGNMKTQVRGNRTCCTVQSYTPVIFFLYVIFGERAFICHPLRLKSDAVHLRQLANKGRREKSNCLR